MAYLSIQNLHRYPAMFNFKEVYALEKIHGTSAHVGWSVDGPGTIAGGPPLRFFSGGEKHEKFAALFDHAVLAAKFRELTYPAVTVYGEAYGGKCQGMSGTYGLSLKFVVFDVVIGDRWLSVPDAAQVATQLGLEFVHYERCSTDILALDAVRDAPSVQARRNGILEDKAREGVVLRPLIELRGNNDERIMCKYKGDAFKETKTSHRVDAGQLQILTDAKAVASEYTTPMRLQHVLQKTVGTEEKHTGEVIRAMIEDVKRESSGEVVWSKEVEKAIGRVTVKLFHEHLRTSAIT